MSEPVGGPGSGEHASAAAAARDPAVTVTVVNYNGAAFIDDCLDALDHLDGAVAEVIVIDNASTDDSVERIRRRGDRLRLVQMDSNEGPWR